MKPLLSIIIPVFRETRVMEPALAHLLELNLSCGWEVVVCDGDPRASTLHHIQSFPVAADVPNLILIRAPKGRGPQMNAGAAKARGDLLLFLHADTRLSPEGVNPMLSSFYSCPATSFCGAFDLAIDARGNAFRAIEKIASLRSRITKIPYGDQGIFISKTLFHSIGGFPDTPIMEDVGLMQRVKKKGVQPLFISHRATTSARRWQTEGILFTTLRNWTLLTLYYLGVPPCRLKRFYKS